MMKKTDNEKRYVEQVQYVIEDVIMKYSKRENNFVPLTSIIGDYSNNILLRAIREVMFIKHVIKVKKINPETGEIYEKKKNLWVYKPYSNFDETKMTYAEFLAPKVLRKEILLRSMLNRIHGW